MEWGVIRYRPNIKRDLTHPMTKSRHILILGGGFAGVYTALYLDKTVAHEQNVEVTIVSAENFVLFTPMLHEVAASDLNPTDIVNPLRQMFRHVRFVEAEAKHIDLQAHRVTVLYSANRKQRDLEYDYLVIAGGSEYNFFGNADPERHSVGMKTITDAMLLRNRIIGLLVPNQKYLKFSHISPFPVGSLVMRVQPS